MDLTEHAASRESPEIMQTILETIIKHPELHPRWLNTLSLLEFMGTRKIARSATLPELDETRLRHLAEEARHAHFFKLMATRLGLSAEQGYEPQYLLSGGAATRYFHGLDAAVNKTSAAWSLAPRLRTTLCYLYVTTLIEERAGVVYKLYDQLLQQYAVPVRLSGILGEEERHLEDMSNALAELDPDWQARLNQFRQVEASLFARFEARLAQQLELAVAA